MKVYLYSSIFNFTKNIRKIKSSKKKSSNFEGLVVVFFCLQFHEKNLEKSKVKQKSSNFVGLVVFFNFLFQFHEKKLEKFKVKSQKKNCQIL